LLELFPQCRPSMRRFPHFLPAAMLLVAMPAMTLAALSVQTPFNTGFALNSPPLRNDFSGFVGMQLTVAGSPIQVTSLGRICATGNSQTHLVKFVAASTGIDVPGASASVSMAGCTPGAFVYALLASAIILPPGGSYYLVSQESMGGDWWYDSGMISTQGVASVTRSIYFYNGSWYGVGGGNTSYVPPDFLYTVVRPSSTPAFVTNYNLSNAPLRNDFGGFVGMKFTVGGTQLNVTSLGRVCVTGNTDTHVIKLVLASTGVDVPGGTASVGMAGCSGGQFIYSALSSPVTLQANTAYYLASQEASGGDQWYDLNGLTTTSDAAVNNSVYFYAGNWNPMAVANTSYVPPNFIYSLPGTVPGTVQVTVQTSIAGPWFTVDGTLYTTPQVFSWTSGVSHTIATTGPQNFGTGSRYNWTSWTDGGAISHSVSPTANTIYTANFTTQFLLTTGVSPSVSGTVTPLPTSALGDGYYDSGTSVKLTPSASSGYGFLNWTGDLSGSSNPQNIAMSVAHSVTANFQAIAGLPTITVTNPVNLTVSGMVAVTATAAASSPATVASVQFILDGSNLASPVTSPPYSVNWDTTLVSNGPHTLKAAVNDSLGQSVTSSQVSVDVNNATAVVPGGTPLVTSYSAPPNYARSDYSGWVGMSFTVNQSSTLVVSALGRICLTGNTATHIVKLVNSATGQDVPAASASVLMAGCTAGQFTYASLPNAVQLDPGSSYYLVSQEVSGGDTWYDVAAVTANGISVNSSIYYWNGTWVNNNDGAKSYVPPNLEFGVAGAPNAPPTVSITTPAVGVTVSGTAAVTSTTAASAPSTVSSVTYYLDGAFLGTASAPSAFAINWDTTQTSDGLHILTAIAVDSSGLTTISAPSPVTVNNGGSAGGDSAFITSYAFYNPRLRNDFTGFAGTQLILTGATPLTVTFVGRGCAPSNSGVHIVKFVDTTSGLDIPGGAASVNMTGCTPGQFSWAALPSPISLLPGVRYYLVSEETIGGDLFYEKAPVTTQSFASITNAVYLQDNGVWHPIAPPNYSYVPPNFK
jgi:hypothetical protein